MTREERHKEIVKYLNSLKNEDGERVFDLKTYIKLRNRDSYSKTRDYTEVSKMTQVICEVFSIASGSAGDIDFYRLFSSYLLDEKKREEINRVL
ncbi:MAG: hypothetical protein ACWA41_10890 [Putridiphycobacter sp.]